MQEFDEEFDHLLTEYFAIEQSIANCKKTMQQCQEEVRIASKYIGEIKGQMLEKMKEIGVISTEVGHHLVSRKRIAKNIVIDDMDKLPESYVQIEKKLLKSKLLKAVRSGKDISGVSLAEQKETIQIKRK